jgi:hypothetical protein
MKTYRVQLCYSGYLDFEIEAGTKEEALELEEAQADPGNDTCARWPQADMIDEIET